MTHSKKTIMPSLKRLFITTALVSTITIGLGACESSKNKYGLSAPTTTASISKAKKSSTNKKTSAKKSPRKKRSAKKSGKQKTYKVAVAEFGGLPNSLAKSFSSRLKKAIKKQHISRPNNEKIKGFFAAKKQGAKTKLTYVLDVTNQDGKRVKRIRGSEMVKGHPSNPWKYVSRSLMDSIAYSTAQQLAGKPVSKKTTVQRQDTTMVMDKTAYRMPSENDIASPKSTASIKSNTSVARNKMAAIVPAVQGAPGDGKVSLTRAIVRHLKSKGVKIQRLQTTGVHAIKGYVSLKSMSPEKDQITIKWLVYNSEGRRLGVVSQKNQIEKGSLNGSWGRIADSAAGAAAKGIRNLLPSK